MIMFFDLLRENMLDTVIFASFCLVSTSLLQIHSLVKDVQGKNDYLGE